MENILYGTKKLLDEQYENGKAFCSGKPFSTYQKVYFATNENIKEYLNQSEIENKDSAISVMASGDHSFGLIEKGILNIDTFDTNALTEFYVCGLKYAMIMRYSYKEYLITLDKLLDTNTSLEELTSIIKNLLSYMDKKYKFFWEEIIDYNYINQKKNHTNINLFNLLFINLISSAKLIDRNNYLKDEKTYNKFKNNLIKSHITFKNVNALDLPNEFKGRYNIMLLSNIFEYLQPHFGKISGYYNIFKYINKYIEDLYKLMDEDAKIFLMYIFDYATKNYTREKLFHSYNVTLRDFDDYKILYEMLKIESCRKEKIQDGVLILKKENSKNSF